MPDQHDLLVWGHVTAVIVWLGGGIFAAALLARVRRAGDLARTVQLVDDALVVCRRLFIPAIVVVLVTGVWLVSDEYGSWPLWTQLGLAGWVASFAIGLLYLDPQVKRVNRLLSQGPELEPEVRRVLSRVLLASRCETVIVFVVASLMVFRPG